MDHCTCDDDDGDAFTMMTWIMIAWTPKSKKAHKKRASEFKLSKKSLIDIFYLKNANRIQWTSLSLPVVFISNPKQKLDGNRVSWRKWEKN